MALKHRGAGLVVGAVVMVVSLCPALAVGPGVAGALTGEPPLTVLAASLTASMSCHSELAGVTRDAVLLVPGTALDPVDNYSWNFERGLNAADIPWCAVTLPHEATGDIAVAAQFVVSAIRSMDAVSGRPVDILGYSQGGMVPRWALKYWPDTRAMVRSFVAIDPSNHGTVDAAALCHVTCPPAFWQQATRSHFLAALNHGPETYPGIDYTVVYSDTDEVVVPNVGPAASSALTPAANVEDVVVQKLCPADTSEHLLMGTADPVAFAVAMDALAHSSLAAPARISRSVCTEGLSPAVDRSTFAVDFAETALRIAAAIAAAPETRSEPPLPAYAAGS